VPLFKARFDRLWPNSAVGNTFKWGETWYRINRKLAKGETDKGNKTYTLELIE
jgi:hypothetical protein